MKNIILLLCTFFIVSFSSCKNRDLQRELEQFTSKTILIPADMRQIVAERDSVVLNPVLIPARFVLWVDSVACSTCQVNKMFAYNEIIRYRDEIGVGFAPIFLFSPPRAKIREVLMNLELSQFEYPVFIDEHQAFSAANPHIPADSRFHSFLLDKNGKVVLVGDPVNNPPLWELYKTTITTLIENDGVMPDVGK